jgi:MGT family glycosyltransferase
VFITHGGLNSIHEGLYCDLPLLVVPQQTEQTFNALRVVELGAGLMLKPDTLNAGNLRDAVTQLLADDRYRSQAKRIGETLRSAGGVTRAVDEIEHLLRR